MSFFIHRILRLSFDASCFLACPSLLYVHIDRWKWKRRTQRWNRTTVTIPLCTSAVDICTLLGFRSTKSDVKLCFIFRILRLSFDASSFSACSHSLSVYLNWWKWKRCKQRWNRTTVTIPLCSFAVDINTLLVFCNVVLDPQNFEVLFWC